MKKYKKSDLGQAPDGYIEILVESFDRNENILKGGHHSTKEIRPLNGQIYSSSLLVECSNKMRENYPVGTVFRLFVKSKQKKDSRPHLYSPHQWRYQVVKVP